MKSEAHRDLGFYFKAVNVVAAVVVFWQAPDMFTPEVATYWLTGSGVASIVWDFLKKNGIKVS